MENFNFKSENISLEAGAEKSKFCDIWPTTKQGLEILRSVVKNPFLKIAIGGLIAVGDALCKH